jgi:hypothetical protein
MVAGFETPPGSLPPGQSIDIRAGRHVIDRRQDRFIDRAPALQ